MNTIIENGKDLIEAKEKVGHGNFQKWVDLCFDQGYRTAHRWMLVAEKFKSDTVSLLELFSNRALYLLSANSTPEPAREEAITRASQGEQITHATAKEIAGKHKIIEEQQTKISALESQIQSLQFSILSAEEEVIPADYEKTKAEVDRLKKKLEEVKGRTDEELQSKAQKIDKLQNTLAKKESELASFDDEKKKIKALGLLSDAQKDISEAFLLFHSSKILNHEARGTIIRHIDSIIESCNEFNKQTNIINM